MILHKLSDLFGNVGAELGYSQARLWDESPRDRIKSESVVESR